MTSLLLALLQATLGSPPDLGPGDRVRVHVFEHRTFLGLPRPEARRARYAGFVTAYAPEDSVALRRTAWILLPGRPREIVAYWTDIGGIDVPEGRNLFGGIMGGVGAALGVALMVQFMDALTCRAWSGRSCVPGFWKLTTRAALITVPIGAVVGAASPRWRPVYWRRPS